MAKHVFVTGGVVSSLGKGITAASLGRLLKARGYKVMMQKADPYLNVDPGTMSPFQHGEVFVTQDGKETDLDLGHYERFIDENLTKNSNFTTGLIYQRLIDRERSGDFLGGTVQVVPHVTNEIVDEFKMIEDTTDADIVITELGGTIGDIEGQPFVEAMRQFRALKGPENVCFIHVSLVPYIRAAHELKTKPTQHSVKELRSMGIQPDFIVCRSEQHVDKSVRAKIASFCDVGEDHVFENSDCESIYDVPEHLEAQGFDTQVLERLDLPKRALDLSEWKAFTQMMHAADAERDVVKIAVVGKYTQLPDAYLSILEAIHHAGVYYGRHVESVLIDGENIAEAELYRLTDEVDGILVPGGFGSRGLEGKMAATRVARENKLPFFGICLGLQVAVSEFAQNVAHMAGAASTEFAPETQYPVIDLMESQEHVSKKGGTMRLGAYPCKITANTLAAEAYQEPLVEERHRHRFEVNNAYRDELAQAGLIFSGTSPDDALVEMVELPDSMHPWFLAAQFHPEFRSRPTRPQPLFREFVRAALAHHDGVSRKEIQSKLTVL